MRKEITIAADARGSRGKNEARRLRAAGRIPAVVYGHGGDAIAVTVSPKEMNRILHSSTGHNTIFDLSVAGAAGGPVMVVDWQHHPVRGSLLHIDMKRIDLTKRIRVKVPVHTHGDPVGVKIQGGLFELINREIEIECLPDDIPEHFTYDVSALEIGQSLRAGDVPLAGSMKLTGHAELVIAHVVSTRGSDETAATEEGAEAPAKAEPEVMKKGKKEEEGAAPAGDKGKKK
ncbi:MAG: 50S ribosomal protein L25 [Acidobacteria bacterium]|nr:50S ribosomal protein L25 [Acidobacteriota bacterium]